MFYYWQGLVSRTGTAYRYMKCNKINAYTLLKFRKFSFGKTPRTPFLAFPLPLSTKIPCPYPIGTANKFTVQLRFCRYFTANTVPKNRSGGFGPLTSHQGLCPWTPAGIPP